MSTAVKKNTTAQEDVLQASDRTVNPVDVSKIKVNDVMAFTYYGVVTETKDLKSGQPHITLTNLVGTDFPFKVHGSELLGGGASADQWKTEEKVTKTRAAEILSSAYNRPLTVSFDKQDGTTRVLRGRLIHSEPLLGRSQVEDLDVTDGDRRRLVDHRTIHYIIVDGVKYTVKK